MARAPGADRGGVFGGGAGAESSTDPAQVFELRRRDAGQGELLRQMRDRAGGDDDPVVMVTYDDCVSYCRWRAAQEKVSADTYRLPTEAQWERAARGGYPDRAYSWGDSIHVDLCNTLEVGRRRTVGVGLGI